MMTYRGNRSLTDCTQGRAGGPPYTCQSKRGQGDEMNRVLVNDDL